MAEKARPRGAGAKPRRDKSRAQSQQSKKASSKSPGRTSSQLVPSPADDGRRSPLEPLDPGPILDDLLDRVMTECALAAAARQRVPFTVSRARDAILFVAEWRFLVRDEGEPDLWGDPDAERDGVWSEDEEPQTCTWDSWTPGVVPVVGVSLPSEQVPSEDVPVTADAGGPPECPGEVPDAVPVPPVLPLSPDGVDDAEPPCQEPPAAAGAPPAQVPDAVPIPAVPRPPSPEPPIAPRPPGRGPRLARPPPARPRPPARLPAKPPEPPAQEPQGSREATAEDGGQVPPPPSSSSSGRASIQPLKPSRGTGVPRLGVRRFAVRWVVPEVRVVGLMSEADRARPGASRTRLPASGSRLVLPGAGRSRKAEPQLCDPWLASARLAPGVTVRWGGSERRGPPMAGLSGQGDGKQEDNEAVRRAEQELKPILPYPECRLSEYE